MLTSISCFRRSSCVGSSCESGGNASSRSRSSSERDGARFSSTAARIGTLIGVALLFGVVNAVLKPIIKVAGCLLYLLTFGLIGFVVNGLLFMFVGWLATKADLPFQVSGFWAGFFSQ